MDASLPATIGPYRNRIIGLRVMPVGALLDNPRNWRRHPDAQKSALDAVMRSLSQGNSIGRICHAIAGLHRRMLQRQL